MIKSIKANTLITECRYCKTETITDLTNVVIGKDEFGKWGNLTIKCSCGAGKVCVLDIPVDATDEPFETGDLPLEEEIQRYYVRLLIRMIRGDFVNEG
jgi:hypothetical protein